MKLIFIFIIIANKWNSRCFQCRNSKQRVQTALVQGQRHRPFLASCLRIAISCAHECDYYLKQLKLKFAYRRTLSEISCNDIIIQIIMTCFSKIFCCFAKLFHTSEQFNNTGWFKVYFTLQILSLKWKNNFRFKISHIAMKWFSREMNFGIFDVKLGVWSLFWITLYGTMLSN